MVVKAYKASPLGRINFSMFDYSACLVREEWRVSRVCHYPTGVEPGVGGGGHPGCHGLQSGVLVGLLIGFSVGTAMAVGREPGWRVG